MTQKPVAPMTVAAIQYRNCIGELEALQHHARRKLVQTWIEQLQAGYLESSCKISYEAWLCNPKIQLIVSDHELTLIDGSLGDLAQTITKELYVQGHPSVPYARVAVIVAYVRSDRNAISICVGC